MADPLAWLLLAFLLARDGAPAARIADLDIALSGRQVAVSFTLAGAFDEPLRERLASGLPTGFVFDLRLYRDRPRWFDNELAATELSVAAMWNAVTREYLINYKQDGRLIGSRVLHDPAELEAAMTRFERVPAFAAGEPAGRARLLVRARADLGSQRLLWLIPTTTSTDWVESRKFRVEP